MGSNYFEITKISGEIGRNNFRVSPQSQKNARKMVRVKLRAINDDTQTDM